MKFEEIDFYDYKIRMCLDNGIRMYLVSDLLRQYNEKHGTNKRFKVSDLLRQYNEKHGTNKRFTDYLRNQQAQELIEHMAKSVRENSPVRSEGGQEGQNSEKTGRENSPVQANGSQNDKFDICDVIQYIKTTTFGGANQGYIVCEELLHACLMWADPAFACDVYRFLTRLRQEDNDYLRKVNEELRRANEELTHANKELKDRRVPNKVGQQWYFFITYIVENDDNVHIYSQHVKSDKWKSTCSKMDREGRVCVYRVKDIPNGFTFKDEIDKITFKDEIDKILLDLCKKYGGKKVRKTHYTIPMDVWEKERFDIIPEIEKEAKQTRVGLGWRSDLDG